MTIICIHSIFTFILTFLLVKTFDKIDETVNIAMNKRDIIGVAIVSLFCSLAINSLHDSFNINYILISIITAFMVMMSYTDLKIMEAYGVINFSTLGLAIIYFIYNIENFKLLVCDKSQLQMITLCSIILVILFMTKGVGLGDTVIYISLLLIYSVHLRFGCLLLIINILLSNALFLITNSFKFLKDKRQKLPLIPHILIAWVALMKFM